MIDDAINKAKEVINKVTSLIKDKVDDALNTLNKLKDKASELVNQATEALKKQLQDIIAKANESIKKLIDKAAELGIDIKECVSDNEERFQKLFETLLADEVGCVTNELNAVLKSITESITAIQKGMSAITNLPNKLAECKNSITCITKLIWEVGKLELQVPAQIAKSVAEITELVAGLQIRLEICATTQLAKAGIETAKVVADVTLCALDNGVSGTKKV